MSKRRACSRMTTNFIFAKYREAKSNFAQKFAKVSVGNFVDLDRSIKRIGNLMKNLYWGSKFRKC
jgi:hypothetical protein